MSSVPNLEMALLAVERACRITRDLQDDLPTDGSRTKADRTPVTVADYAAQAAVGLTLGGIFVGEESASGLESDPALAERALEAARLEWPELERSTFLDAIRLGEGATRPEGFWTLDPVDGTKGFLRREQYCVSLAWVEGGEPKLGVLGCPRLAAAPGQVAGEGALVWAERGAGARWSPLDRPSESTRFETPLPRARIRIAESAEAAHTDQTLGPSLLARAGLEGDAPVRVDSQVKYAIVARGDAEVFLRRPRSGYVEAIWDHAAGSLISSEAGCVVTDLSGRTLDFGHGRRLEQNDGMLVAPAELHERLLTALGED